MNGFWTDAAVREALGGGAERRHVRAGARARAGAGEQPGTGAAVAPRGTGTGSGAVAHALTHGKGRGTPPSPSPSPSPSPYFTAVATDTRTLTEGALFVALRGERFDAHEFLGEAAAKGARGAVVDRVPDGAPEDLVYYVVPDTLVALGRLARHYRVHLGARVCAIVGSNGKTTTKELARVVLETRYRVHATKGNLNNRIGVPLTVLAAPAETEALVVEAGTNIPGEIAELATILEPDAVIITGIAEEHLEGLGDLEGVLREETSMLPALRPEGFALVADDPAVLVERARELAPRVAVAGWTERADPQFRAESLALDEAGRARFYWRGHEVRLSLHGRPNARNALLALGLGAEWGVDEAAAAAAVATVAPAAMRAEIRRVGGLTVIVDCYNANPASVAAAVDLLISLPRGGGRVAVLGTMRELGSGSAELHRRTAEAVSAAAVDLIVATGEFVAAFEPLADSLGARLVREEDPLDAYPLLARRLTGEEVVLLKGSRGVALERLLPHLEADWADSMPIREVETRRRRDDAGPTTGA
ncbi:MAG TPA: UDP-N-acetylmuramoyl-tripeptide--D-alanyl-D-alanine ligase [Longimicrobiales bacterium]